MFAFVFLAIVYCNLLCLSESYMFGAPVCCFVFMQ